MIEGRHNPLFKLFVKFSSLHSFSKTDLDKITPIEILEILTPIKLKQIDD